MKWIWHESDKSSQLERYFLVPDDWEDTAYPLHAMEWCASVTLVGWGDASSGWIAIVENDELDVDFMSELCPTRGEAERWAELEIQPERIKIRLVELALDGEW